MCELHWDALAEIQLKSSEHNKPIYCKCSRVFVRNKDILKATTNTELSASEDDIPVESDSYTYAHQISNQKLLQKPEGEHETLSCYCSASHTDNLSTDEHDSQRENPDTVLQLKGLQQSDSGADLTEYLKHDLDTEWTKFWSLNGEKLIWESWLNKYSAYINPEYLSYNSPTINDSNSANSVENDPKSESGVPKSESVVGDKFSFNDKDLKSFNAEIKTDDLRNRLRRELSGSDEKLFTEVSEGWNPLSPLSIDCETEAERLLSSRCGSHASSSVRTVDSMTNVTRMTVSSLDFSASSSDSFSSVSSVQSSLSSEEPEEDYHQWNILWKKHYEEEYLEQYNKFIASFGKSTTKHNQAPKTAKNIPKFLPKCEKTTTVDSLSAILSNLKVNDKDMESNNEEVRHVDSAEMAAMGLPLSFGRARNTSNQKNIDKILPVNKEFDAGRNRIRAAFNLMGIEFKEGLPLTGTVDYKMKHIRLQNRHLKMHSAAKKPKHIRFDDEGVPLDREDDDDETHLHSLLSDSTDEDEQVLLPTTSNTAKIMEANEMEVTKRKKRKKKPSYPAEIKENTKLRKYWHRRFSLFSKFDQGIKLDEESWYSVTPELVAKHTAEKCKCNIIVDAFCGAGGNSIQFALTCDRVISIDIDPKKIEMAKNNAEVYGVSDKIEFIVGDFLQLADSIKADVVFLSPPWGGPAYLNQNIYDLEEMLQPVPYSTLLRTAKKVSKNVAAFLPKNSNTFTVINEAGEGNKVEIEQNFINKRLIAITAYYNDLILNK